MQDYRRNWIQHVNRMACNRLQKIIINYRTKGENNQWRPLHSGPEYLKCWPKFKVQLAVYL